MKKKILSFVLCICLVCSAFVFTACKKDPGYKLANLYVDYAALASANSTIEFNEENNRLEFDYSAFENTDGKNYFLNALSKQDLPFKHLNDFNTIYYNSMEFVNNNIRAISSNAFEVKRSLRNDIKNQLQNLKTALGKVNTQTGEFARNISANEEDFTNELYLIPFKHLLDSYEELYDCCYQFSLSFARIYYSIENDVENTNYFEKGLDLFTIGDIDVNIRHLPNRAKLCVSFLSYEYYEQNIQNGKLSTILTTKTETGFADMGDEFNTYTSKVNQISYDIVTHRDASKVDREEFYNCIVELYNIRKCLENEFELYCKATSTIDYKNVKGHFTQTEYEKACLKVIEHYYYLQGQNYLALQKIYKLV